MGLSATEALAGGGVCKNSVTIHAPDRRSASVSACDAIF